MATAALKIHSTDSANGTSYASGSFVPAAGDYLVVFVVASGTAAAAPTLTDSQGIGFTLVDSQIHFTVNRIYLFKANGAAAASSMTVTFACTADAATGAHIVVFAVSGSLLDIVQSGKGTGASSTTPAVVMPGAFNTANVGVGVCGNGSNPAAVTQPGSWTEDDDLGFTSPATGAESCHRNSGETGSTITWGSTSASGWGAMVAEIAPSVSGPSPSTVSDTGTGTDNGSVAVSGTDAGTGSDTGSYVFSITVLEAGIGIPGDATSVLDNFNRADEGPPMTGWTTWGGTDGLRIVSNQVVGGTASVYNRGYWTTAMGGPDVEAYITLPSVNSTLVCNACVRLDPAAGTCYEIAQNGGSVNINKRTSPTNSSSIASWSTGGYSAGDKIGIRCRGSAIEAWYKGSGGTGPWTLLGSVEDTSYSGASPNNKIGIVAFSNNQPGDDFGGGVIVRGATENATVSVPISVSDSGSGSDTSVISYALSGSDTGTDTETSKIAIIVSDSGSGTDSSIFAALFSSSDSGTGADPSVISYALSGTDSGSVVENGSVSIAGVLINGTDSGSGADTSVISTVLTSVDSGTGTDASVVSVALFSTDIATGVDTGTSGTPISGVDSGAGADASVIITILSSSDSGTGVEASRISLVVSDSGTGSETSALKLSFITTDSGAGVDASIVRAALLSSDTGAGLDIGGTPITGTDSGFGSDRRPKKAAGGFIFLFGDTSLWGDISIVTAQIPVLETGVAVEVTSLKSVFSDAGAAVEITGLSRILSEAGTGVDTGAISVALPVADIGVGTDNAAVKISVSSSDSGSGSDSLALSRVLSDSGSGTELQSIAAVLSDSGISTDVISTFSRTVSDSIFSIENSISGVSPDNVITTDSGSSTENASVAGTSLVVSDGGTGSDASLLTSAFTQQEVGSGTENQFYVAVTSASDSGFSSDTSELAARFTLIDSGSITENFAKGVLIDDVGSGSETQSISLILSEFALVEDETSLFREVFDFGIGITDGLMVQLDEDYGFSLDEGFISYNIGITGTGRRPLVIKTKDRAKLASAN